jgi:predicted component of type VI protein secretion system
MSLADRVVAGLRTMVLIDERVSRLDSSLTTLRDTMQAKIADHETRLTRIETIIEIARPDGSTLRVAAPGPAQGGSSPPEGRPKDG